MRYCSKQEHCLSEVRKKLTDWALPDQYHDAVLEKLEDQGFIDELRYAGIYARSKFNQNGWGNRKITEYLKAKGITQSIINKGLLEIEPDEYQQGLTKLMTRKVASLNEADQYVSQQKTAQYLVRKGFEPDLVWKTIKGEEH